MNDETKIVSFVLTHSAQFCLQVCAAMPTAEGFKTATKEVALECPEEPQSLIFRHVDLDRVDWEQVIKSIGARAFDELDKRAVSM